MNKRRNIIICLVAGVLLVLVVILLVFSGSWFGQKTGFKISNSDDYLKNVKQADKDNLLMVIGNQVKNVSGIDLEQNLVEGVIREGSYKEELQPDMVISSFLIDIDAVQQTYTVEFPWSRDIDVSDGITVECPRNNLAKYPDSYCTGIYTTSATIGIYLPYEGNVNGNKYSVYENYLVENGLDLFVTACGDEKMMDLVKNDFEGWINNTRFLENIYNINVVDICNQFNE